MAIWFMRVSALICLTSIVGVVSLFARDWYREAASDAAIAAAQQHVQSLGGSLSQDGYDNDFIIELGNSEVSDAQIAELVVVLRPLANRSPHFADVPQNFAFNLAGTRVGDEGVQAISTLPVTWLNLNGTQITDQSLVHLRYQRQLSILTVGGTKVTKPGIESMRHSLPHIWIPLSGRSPVRP